MGMEVLLLRYLTSTLDVVGQLNISMDVPQERRLPLTLRPGAEENRTGPFGEEGSLVLVEGMVG